MFKAAATLSWVYPIAMRICFIFAPRTTNSSWEIFFKQFTPASGLLYTLFVEKSSTLTKMIG